MRADILDHIGTDIIEPTAFVPPDRFTLRPLYAPSVAALLAGTAYSFDELAGLFTFLIVAPFMVIVWLMVMGAYIFGALRSRLWRRSVSFLVIVIGAWPIMGAAIYFGGDYVHFALRYPFYETELEQHPDRYSKPISFPWRGRGFVGTVIIERSVVYDATGAMARKVGSHRIFDDPRGWQVVDQTVWHLCGSFYLVIDRYGA